MPGAKKRVWLVWQVLDLAFSSETKDCGVTYREGTLDEEVCISGRKICERDAKRDSREVVARRLGKGYGGGLAWTNQRIHTRHRYPGRPSGLHLQASSLA